MKIIDITRNIHEAPIYPGAEPTKIDRISDMAKGDAYNFSLINTNSHAGTHADAYCHFLKDNKVTIDQMKLDKYYGSCRVVTVPKNTPITKETIFGKLDGCSRLVIHGGGLSYFTKDGTEYLVECGIETVVTDAWSVAPLNNETEIHEIMLGHGIAIIENAILDGVPDGNYTLAAFPIKWGGCDGAPVRAVLIVE